MPTRHAEAVWEGNLAEGAGRMKLGGGAYEGPYSFKSRMEEGPGTNPEELIAAAHAGCFSMAFSAQLASAGVTPRRVHTTARVTFEKGEGGWAITSIELDTRGEVPGIDAAKFAELAEGAKKGCPVSKALAAVADIRVKATLL